MLDVKTVLPQKDRVVVRLLNLDEVYGDLVLQHQSDEERIAVRYGEVIALGPEADQPSHCPGLKVGDLVVFTQFAGAYLPTDDTESLYKIVRGYDIVGMKKEKDKGDDSKWIPTSDRLLVEIVDLTKKNDDVILNGAQDPRLAELHYGVILKKGEEANHVNVKVGDLVAFDPYVGTVIRHYESEEQPELRMIVDFDVLLKVKK